MKRTAFIFILLAYLASCNNGTSQSLDTSVSQDTLKSNQIAASPGKDSVISNGEYIEYYKNGVTKMRGVMKDGKRDGVWKSFYGNGLPWSETTFKNGLKEGKTTTWFENSQKRYEGFYQNDVESGKWTFWDEKGNFVSQKDYNSGK
jgi:antitoxin component YwqK of YwqJK toxin-antitoxin module